MINCMILENFAKYGGGGYFAWQNSFSITNSTVIRNIAKAFGGFYYTGSYMTVKNCILWDNAGGSLEVRENSGAAIRPPMKPADTSFPSWVKKHIIWVQAARAP